MKRSVIDDRIDVDATRGFSPGVLPITPNLTNVCLTPWIELLFNASRHGSGSHGLHSRLQEPGRPASDVSSWARSGRREHQPIRIRRDLRLQAVQEIHIH